VKSSDKFSFDELRRANQRPAPKQVSSQQRPYNWYEAASRIQIASTKPTPFAPPSNP
jgi:hypothetical protein